MVELALLGTSFGNLWQQRRLAGMIRDPLTAPRTPAVSLPQTQTAGAQSFPPMYTATQTCECQQPGKKRGKKKRRTVCYTGTFTERATGLSKRKRRKVPCK